MTYIVFHLIHSLTQESEQKTHHTLNDIVISIHLKLNNVTELPEHGAPSFSNFAKNAARKSSI